MCLHMRHLRFLFALSPPAPPPVSAEIKQAAGKAFLIFYLNRLNSLTVQNLFLF